jgi:hypothetical protein
MATATVRLPETLQALVDARLDTIDRLLLKSVPRQDRLAIVSEVESQIYELLQERGGDDLSRKDVLDVLAHLDPPEAYLSDESGEDTVTKLETAPERPTPTAATNSPAYGVASGVLGVICLSMLFLIKLMYLCFIATHWVAFGVLMEGLLLVGLITVPIMGLVGLVLASFAQLRGKWAVLGFVAGIVSLLCSVAGALLFLH